MNNKIFLTDNNGVNRGRICAAFIANESIGNIIMKPESEYLLNDILNSEELVVASSNETCKVLSIKDRVISIDHPVCSVDADKVLDGEVIIIHPKE